MKFFFLAKNRPVSNAIRKTNRPPIQPLECRRLMSLTAAPEFVPMTDAPAQIVHSFGFENLLPPPPGVGGLPLPLPPIAAPAGGSTNAAAVEPQSSRTMTPVTSTPATPPTNPPSATSAPTTGASLWELYATLNNSTVAELDRAALYAAPETSSVETPASPQTTPIVANPTDAPVTSKDTVDPIAPTVALPATLQPTISDFPDTESEIARSMVLKALEQDLASVSAHAQEMIFQLVRDAAIDLAHSQATSAVGAAVEQIAAPQNGWRSAAIVAGAAIALGSSMDWQSRRSEPKEKSLFSNEMIRGSIV